MRCPECDGYRLRPQALYVKIEGPALGTEAEGLAWYHIGEVAELTTQDAQHLFDGLTLTVGASVGVATASAENVVHDADTALYEAKRARRAKPSLWARRAKRVVRAVSPDTD